MISNDTKKIIQNLFGTFLCKYQTGLEQLMGANNFIFDFVSAILYVCNKITMIRGGSYTDFGSKSK